MSEQTVCKNDLLQHLFELSVLENPSPLRDTISKGIASGFRTIVTHMQINDGLGGRLSGDQYNLISQGKNDYEKARSLIVFVWRSRADSTLLRFLYAVYAECPNVLEKIEPCLHEKVGELVADEMTQSGQFLDRCRPLRERLNAALKDLPTKQLSLLVVGKTGVGKSSLVNSLLGKHVAIESHSTTRGTSSVECHEADFDDMKVRVWDTPGLWDFEVQDVEGGGYLQLGRSKEYLAQMKKIGRVDLVLLCVDAAASNCDYPATDDEDTVEVLTKSFKKDIWSHAIVVLTKANMLRSPDDADDSRHLALVVKGFTRQYRDILSRKGGVSDNEAKLVPCLPVGSARDLILSDGNPWLPELWTTAVEKSRQGGNYVFMEWNMKRVKARQLEEGDDRVADSKTIVLSPEQVRRMTKVIGNLQHRKVSTKYMKLVAIAGAGGIVCGVAGAVLGAAAGGIGASVGAVAFPVIYYGYKCLSSRKTKN